MWGVGLTMCIVGILALFSVKLDFRRECLLVFFILSGLVAMWVAP